MVETSEVQRFVDSASHFCALVSARDPMPARDFLVRVHQSLAPLYAAAMTLPDYGAAESDCESDAEEQATIHGSLRAKLSGYDYYSDVFDPFELPAEAPGVGMLSDDLGDIYSELAVGLHCWARGQHPAAVWHWRFGFRTHWGRHLTSALRALHVLSYDLDWARPSMPEA